MKLGLGLSLTKSNVVQGFLNTFSLNFDGTNDYVAIGASNAVIIGTNHTISTWFKNSSGGMAYIFQNRRSIGSTNLSLGINFNVSVGQAAGYVGLVMYNGSGHTVTVSDENINDGAWHHLAATISDGAQKLYLDGSEVASSTAAFDNEASSDISTIGSQGGSNRFMNGNLDEFALWNTVLDADAITAIYNSGTPISLSSDSGDYDNSSNLQGYWRMGDGTLDEYPLIADQTNATLGDDLFDADAYATGTGNWYAYTGNTIENDDGAIKTTYGGSATGSFVYFRDAYQLSSDLTVGKIYKLTFDVKTNSGSSVNVEVYDGSSSSWVVTGVTSTDYIAATHYFVAANATTAYIRTSGLASGEIIWIKNMILREVQGNPGFMNNMVSGDIEEETP
jgi:hypothetical protein